MSPDTVRGTRGAVPRPPLGTLSRVRRRVTFSRNVTLSLSRTCVSHCKYCAFATHQPHLHTPDEVEALVDGAARRGVKELLVLTGDDPSYHPGVRARLAELGFDDFVAYVGRTSRACARSPRRRG
jgi:2-iminoacetate synthase ThiH